MNEKLKQKFDRTKEKIKSRTPEILAFTSVAVAAVIVVRAIKKDLSNPTGFVETTTDEPSDDTITRMYISADEMKRRLRADDISAYSVEGRKVTFYDISDSED